MAINKITAREIAENAVEGNLPDRPSQESLYAERGMTAAEVKAAYDRLPKLIADRFNALVDAIGCEASDDGIAASILTGITEGHTLNRLFLDILSGAFADYLSIDGERTLREALLSIPDPLPALTEEDDGKLLTAEGGAWVAKEPTRVKTVLSSPLLALSESVVSVTNGDSAADRYCFYKDGVLLAESVTGSVDLASLGLTDGVYAINARAIPTNAETHEESCFGNTLVYIVGEINLPYAEGVSF